MKWQRSRRSGHKTPAQGVHISSVRKMFLDNARWVKIMCCSWQSVITIIGNKGLVISVSEPVSEPGLKNGIDASLYLLVFLYSAGITLTWHVMGIDNLSLCHYLQVMPVGKGPSRTLCKDSFFTAIVQHISNVTAAIVPNLWSISLTICWSLWWIPFWPQLCLYILSMNIIQPT